MLQMMTGGRKKYTPAGLVLSVDTLAPKNNRGAKLQTSYAGDQYLAGVNIGANPAVSSKGLDVGPAYTELFATAPTTSVVKILTAQKYCLQVKDGSATCSYGTATPTSPLQFTATAGNVTFTPTGCTLWNLTAAGGYVFDMIPHGSTKSSSAATSSGNGASVLMDDALVGALRGVSDEVELWNSPSVDTIDPNNYSIFDETTRINRIVSDGTYVDLAILSGVNTTDRYLIKFTWISGSGSLQLYDATGAETLSGSKTFVHTFTTTTLSIKRIAACDVTFKVSVQKLNPAECTVLSEMYMGVGSAELPRTTSQINSITCKNTADSLLSFRGDATLGQERISVSTDSVNFVALIGNWSRDEVHKRAAQSNGTQFRVGYRRYESDGITPISDWVWSTYSAFDGSFDPLEYLRFGYLNTVPMWLRKCVIWNRGDVTAAELDNPFEVAA
jgi:hypothetical protein